MIKSIVVCCDGTWNKADQKYPTNVEKFRWALEDSDRLVAEHFPGVGTEDNVVDKFFGGAFGRGLSKRVREAYRFIAEKYEDGDQIYLIGFSRGAYTARSVAGMIRNVGILPPNPGGTVDEKAVRKAFRMYRNRNNPAKDPDGALAKKFMDDHGSRSTRIRFIGVWDTVGALGIPLGPVRWLNFLNRGSQFHDVTLSSTVDAAFQALAIDERRRPFRPTLWKLSQTDTGDRGQAVEQVWFSGVHCNIGGGYPDTGLSDISLQWMADKAQRHGLVFKPGTLGDRNGKVSLKNGDIEREIPVIPWWEGTIRNSRIGFYRLTPPLVRPIGRAKSVTTEWASSTAKRRLDDAHYQAPNLVDYLDRRNGRTRSLSHVVSLPSRWPNLHVA